MAGFSAAPFNLSRSGQLRFPMGRHKLGQQASKKGFELDWSSSCCRHLLRMVTISERLIMPVADGEQAMSTFCQRLHLFGRPFWPENGKYDAFVLVTKARAREREFKIV